MHSPSVVIVSTALLASERVAIYTESETVAVNCGDGRAGSPRSRVEATMRNVMLQPGKRDIYAKVTQTGQPLRPPTQHV